MVEIVKGVFFLNGGWASSNSVIIKKEKCILVDPGLKKYHHLILKEMKKLNLPPVEEIWLTHAHPDHLDGIDFWEDVKILCHPIGREILESKYPLSKFVECQEKSIKPLLVRIFKGNDNKIRIINWIVKKLCERGVKVITSRWEGIKIYRVFKHEEIRYGIKILYLPGHTPHEVGFWLEGERVVITGDLVSQLNSNPITALNLPVSDIDLALESLKKLLSLKPKIIIPAHGDIISNPIPFLKYCIKDTSSLKEKAHTLYFQHLSKYKKLKKWFSLYPMGCRLQQRLVIGGVLAKSVIKKRRPKITNSFPPK